MGIMDDVFTPEERYALERDNKHPHPPGLGTIRIGTKQVVCWHDGKGGAYHVNPRPSMVASGENWLEVGSFMAEVDWDGTPVAGKVHDNTR